MIQSNQNHKLTKKFHLGEKNLIYNTRCVLLVLVLPADISWLAIVPWLPQVFEMTIVSKITQQKYGEKNANV